MGFFSWGINSSWQGTDTKQENAEKRGFFLTNEITPTSQIKRHAWFFDWDLEWTNPFLKFWKVQWQDNHGWRLYFFHRSWVCIESWNTASYSFASFKHYVSFSDAEHSKASCYWAPTGTVFSNRFLLEPRAFRFVLSHPSLLHRTVQEQFSPRLALFWSSRALWSSQTLPHNWKYYVVIDWNEYLQKIALSYSSPILGLTTCRCLTSGGLAASWQRCLMGLPMNGSHPRWQKPTEPCVMLRSVLCGVTFLRVVQLLCGRNFPLHSLVTMRKNTSIFYLVFYFLFIYYSFFL